MKRGSVFEKIDGRLLVPNYAGWGYAAASVANRHTDEFGQVDERIYAIVCEGEWS